MWACEEEVGYKDAPAQSKECFERLNKKILQKTYKKIRSWYKIPTGFDLRGIPLTLRFPFFFLPIQRALMYDISEAELPNNLAFGNLFRYRVLGQFNFCINYILPSQPPAYPLSKMLLENSGSLWVGCSPPLSQYTSYKPTIFWQVWMKERGANRNLRYSGILISLKKDIFIIKGTQPRKGVPQ